ncbi:MAG: ECF-type sigma factor [Phycisphaerales bacterium]
MPEPKRPSDPPAASEGDTDTRGSLTARTQLTRLLADATSGDTAAIGRVLPMVYAELLDLARRQMRGAGVSHTLQPTALVHEAWLRIAGSGGSIRDRSHFWAVAATAMRQILVDHARRKRRQKRGGNRARVELDAIEVAVEDSGVDVLALDEALTRLSVLEPRLARTVELRFFGGLSVDDTAEVLEVGTATVKRDWALARAWLRRELDDGYRGEAEPERADR